MPTRRTSTSCPRRGVAANRAFVVATKHRTHHGDTLCDHLKANVESVILAKSRKPIIIRTVSSSTGRAHLSPNYDCPVAHSMDTTWFAADSNGHIALFDTGENGALPTNAPTAGGASEPSFDTFTISALLLTRSALDTSTKQDLEKFHLTGPESRLVIVAESTLVASAEGYRESPEYSSEVEKLFVQHELMILKEHDPRVLVTTAPIKAARISSITKAPGLIAIYDESQTYDVIWARELWEQAGIFGYQHEFGNDPVFYRRTHHPASPISINDLPQPAHSEISSFVLPVQFSNDSSIDLVEHIPAAHIDTWGDAPLKYSEESDSAYLPPPIPKPVAPPPPSIQDAFMRLFWVFIAIVWAWFILDMIIRWIIKHR